MRLPAIDSTEISSELRKNVLNGTRSPLQPRK
jgi:hypothetical protein